MVEVVVKLGLKREPGYLYLVGNGKLYRTKMVAAGERSAEPKRELGPEDVVVDLGITQDPDYDYFIDRNGDISRTRRQGPRLVHAPGDFDEPADVRKRRLELFAERAKDLVGPCSVCGKPVLGRDPARDEDGRRRHPSCAES